MIDFALGWICGGVLATTVSSFLILLTLKDILKELRKK